MIKEKNIKCYSNSSIKKETEYHRKNVKFVERELWILLQLVIKKNQDTVKPELTTTSE